MNNKAGADPEKNLTRAQPKARGYGYMGVAISMSSYRHDLVDAAQLSFCFFLVHNVRERPYGL